MQRVQKLISNRGFCSRRKAEELIEEGKVKVNGKTISLGDKAEETDEISIDGEVIGKERKRYILFHKPVGCVSAIADQHERTIMAYIKVPERVFPIGRLDKDTSGLMILTNDGDFANKIMHPRYEIKKTYVATIDRELTPSEIKKLEEGVDLEDGRTRPAKVNTSGKIITLTIHQGKNRIIRRMLEYLSCNVLSLERSKIGNLTLDIPIGEWRDLTSKELELLNPLK